MRASAFAFASLLVACAGGSPPDASPVEAAILCETLTRTLCDADRDCCPSHPHDCLETQRARCDGTLGALARDPRVAWDPRAGGAFAEAFEAAGGTACGAELPAPARLFDAFAGTGAEGADCTPPSLEGADLRLAALSCEGALACRVYLGASGAPEGVCEPREDDACSHPHDCAPDHFCRVDGAWEPGVWGSCRPRKVEGWACSGDLECASGFCGPDGACALPAASDRCALSTYGDLVNEAMPRLYLAFEGASGVTARDGVGGGGGTLARSAMRVDGGAFDPPPAPEPVEGEGEGDGDGDTEGGETDATEPPTGRAVRFAEDADEVIARGVTWSQGAGRTAELWVLPEAAEGERPLLRWESADGAVPLALVRSSAGRLEARLRAEGEEPVTLRSDEGALGSDRWHHVALTLDGERARLFLDGREVASAASALPAFAPGTLRLGQRPAASEGESPAVALRGRMDEVALYPRALGGATLRRHHRAGRDGGTYAPALPPWSWLEGLR